MMIGHTVWALLSLATRRWGGRRLGRYKVSHMTQEGQNFWIGTYKILCPAISILTRVPFGNS